MEIFTVNGKDTNFADVIIKHRINGEKCVVASYWFGVRMVERIIQNFKSVMLVSDSSHSTLNPKAYKKVVALDRRLDDFEFVTIKTHAKFAIIDNKTLIFTSANLSANQRMESYLIADVAEVVGCESIVNKLLGREFEREAVQQLDDDDLLLLKSIEI